MKAFKSMSFGLMLVLTLAAVAPAQNDTESQNGMVFRVDDPMNRNSVTFKSTAPLEDIVGTSSQVTGQLVFDPANPNKGGYGELSVPVRSLGTGIPLRDEHLASANWLNAEANPDIVFKIVEVKNIKPVKTTADASTFDVIAVGDFSLNGVTRRLSVPARITFLKENEMTKQRQPGNLLAARTTFDITLADYGVTGPKGMKIIGNKVGKKVEVSLSVVGSSAGASMAGNSESGNKK